MVSFDMSEDLVGGAAIDARGAPITDETMQKARDAGILVAVHDTGPGIAPKQLDRIFNSFYTTKPSGTGMGLAICRSIIDAHGGRLWVEANEPRGAIFQFTVPSAEKGNS